MSVLDKRSRLLTLDEVADRLRISRRTVERMVSADLLPAYRVARRAVRVDENQLEDWIYGSDDPGASSSAPDPVSAPNPSPGQSTSAPRTGEETS